MSDRLSPPPRSLMHAATVIRRGIAAAACVAALTIAWTAPLAAGQQQPAAPADPTDALGRDTPRGTVEGFTFSTRSGDLETAARYLQLTDALRADAPALTRDLERLIDRYFTRPLFTLSAAPEGTPRDGLPPDRDRMPLAIGDRTVDLLLVRVNDPAAGPIWLFSSESLERLSAAPEVLAQTWAERLMPAALLQRSVLGLSFAQWILWLLSIAGPLLLLRSIAAAGVRIAARRGVTHSWLDPWHRALHWPAIVALTVAIHLLLVTQLGVTLSLRVVYSRWVSVALVLACAWFAWRLLALSSARTRSLALRRGQTGIASLMLLVERIAKALVVVVTAFLLLTMAGLDTSTALAGVGIGGIAIALGAQKSVENLLGGVFLLADGALAVGDFCRIADRTGWVEDITLRSVRLRTVEQTLLSIPAGVLAQASIENFVSRQKMLIQTTLPLHYETSAAQLQQIIDGITHVLATDRNLESETARVRLVNFSATAIELELYTYAQTMDAAVFTRIREAVLLQAFAIVESAGARFARPTEVVLAAGRQTKALPEATPSREPART